MCSDSKSKKRASISKWSRTLRIRSSRLLVYSFTCTADCLPHTSRSDVRLRFRDRPEQSESKSVISVWPRLKRVRSLNRWSVRSSSWRPTCTRSSLTRVFGKCLLEMATGEYPYQKCTKPFEIYKRVTQGNKLDCYNRVDNQDLREWIDLWTRFDVLLIAVASDVDSGSIFVAFVGRFESEYHNEEKGKVWMNTSLSHSSTAAAKLDIQ